MARYKGNYKDLFKDTATYTVDLKETKTVKGESNSNFQAGMGLTVNSGKLIIKADTLDETLTQWSELDKNWKKMDLGWVTTQNYLGVNINLYGAFFLSTVNTHSIAGVIVSNGKAKWRNVNLIQLLYGEVAKQEVHECKTITKATKVFTGLRLFKVTKSFWNNAATRIL
jgi:hypothetical protein